VDRRSVYETLQDEIIELVGDGPYRRFVDHVTARGQPQYLPHPALRVRHGTKERR
jgi:hypothetical protein